MKKLIKNTAILATGLLMVTGCSGDFLDHTPTDSVDSGLAPTPENAERIFIGAWYNLMEYGTTYANIGYRALSLADDMMGSDVVLRTANTYGFSATYKLNEVSIPTAGRVSFAWTTFYKTIDNCNSVISIKGDTKDEDFRYAQGQALALRAFCYLHLVQHYQFTYLKDKSAPCVPLYTEPTTSKTEPKGRATVEEIYTQIFKDLEQAKTDLDGFTPSTAQEKYKPNVSVVNGLLARAYLLTGQYEEAAKAAKAAQEGYPLMKDAATYKGFNDISNSEWIWGHPQSTTQSDPCYNFYYVDAEEPDSYNSFMADPHFYNLFSKNDIRRELFKWMREGYMGYCKFRIRADQTGDIVVMRSAEMYLIEAEAMARDNTTSITDAVAPLNTLRNARGLTDYDVTGKNKQDLVEEILVERRRKLWGEGFSMTDILRTQKSLEREMLTKEEMAQIEGIKIIPGDKPEDTKYLIDCWQEDGTYEENEPIGHYEVAFPNGTEFTPNSSYYLYAIPESETNANPNIP